ncbi:MAG: hypothetical protein EKD82_00685 [Candidatus Symbiopectobacterium sp. PLON1]|nr:hypothetical protein [Candidatus Symbiopectobacterium sp. PLON1]
MAQLGQSIPRIIQLKRTPEAGEASLSLPSGSPESPLSPSSDALCSALGVVSHAEIVVVLCLTAQQLRSAWLLRCAWRWQQALAPLIVVSVARMSLVMRMHHALLFDDSGSHPRLYHCCQ